MADTFLYQVRFTAISERTCERYEDTVTFRRAELIRGMDLQRAVFDETGATGIRIVKSRRRSA